MVDVYVMLAFGLLGYLMTKGGFHPAPMILGLILGPIAEKGFRQAVTLSHGDLGSYFFQSPITIVLIVLTLLSVATPLYLNRRKRSQES